MWILENSTNLLSSLAHLGVRKTTFIETFHFSTLYISISLDLLKSRMNSIINNAFKQNKLHDTSTSEMAKIKAISPMIL